MALRTDQPHTVFSAEHLVAALHGWVCYCAPIRAADGTLLGVLDLSTTWKRSHPLAMATVRTMTSAIESKVHAAVPAPAGMRLTSLGTGRLMRDGQQIRLRPRHLEILTLLALDDDGYSHERLHYAVYGDRAVGASTLKSEMSYLRRATGGDITSRVYRFTTALSCDAVDVLRAIERGDLDTAVRLYHGRLLPDSDTPGISEWRDYLEVAMRNAVLNSPDANHALAYGDCAPDDIAVHEHALALLPARDAAAPSPPPACTARFAPEPSFSARLRLWTEWRARRRSARREGRGGVNRREPRRQPPRNPVFNVSSTLSEDSDGRHASPESARSHRT
ncbi:hypothetical protein ACTWPB_12200 [Nocardia sp. IBHARD005]|uniref:hypothetical protein n=1 Tax=Nocardia sp. IBHARD005 TaxID=3457765 RepID=UPI004057ED49